MSIYKEFFVPPEGSAESSDILADVKDTVSSGMWANGAGTITAYYTSSTQSSSNAQYYLDVYSANPATDSAAQAQFSIAYGHFNGSGSAGAVGVDGKRASAAVYRQLANTLLGPNESQFVFGGSGAHTTPDFVYAISIARQQLREKMDPGNWELHLSGSGNTTIKLIDDSAATTNPSVNQGGRVFNIKSGSIATGTAVEGTSVENQPGGAYGLFYPDVGILILNGPVLNASASLATASGSNAEGGNVGKFWNAISLENKFQARREEVITSQHYFCRVPNRQFNFSANPTYTSGSDGTMAISSMINNPKAYITQVGLYNNSNELLAVAKLSKPLLKSFSREAIIKVKLDF